LVSGVIDTKIFAPAEEVPQLAPDAPPCPLKRKIYAPDVGTVKRKTNLSDSTGESEPTPTTFLTKTVLWNKFVFEEFLIE
jgi:hypothetical protein